MAKRLEVELDDGTEGWIDISASVEKAAMAQAWKNDQAPSVAIEEFLLDHFGNGEADSDEE